MPRIGLGSKIKDLALRNTADGPAQPDPTRQLSAWLAAGNTPEPVPCPIVLMEGEHCYGHTRAALDQLLTGDGTYVHKSGGFIAGGLVSMVAVGSARGAVNAVGNRRRRQAAEREAAAQFRPVDAGELYLTDRRLALAGQEWVDVWHSDIRQSQCTPDGITLSTPGVPVLRLRTGCDPYWYLLFRHIAYGERPAAEPS